MCGQNKLKWEIGASLEGWDIGSTNINRGKKDEARGAVVLTEIVLGGVWVSLDYNVWDWSKQSSYPSLGNELKDFQDLLSRH